jgi:hypothetical protein
MKTTVALLLPALMLVACGKKAPNPEPTPVQAAPVAAAPAPAPAPTPAAAPAAAPTGDASSGGPMATPVVSTENMSSEQKELANKQAKLDYSNMENGYMTDVRAQWAAAATATSTYNSHEATLASGKVDGQTWVSNGGNVGFDSLEASFTKPVNVTELRIALPDGDGVEGISKLELQDTDGKWNTVWSGVQNVKRDHRGPRTWYVQPIPKTAYKAKAAKITVANNLLSNRVEIDAVQLIGD